jgi:hypothetical protein
LQRGVSRAGRGKVTDEFHGGELKVERQKLKAERQAIGSTGLRACEARAVGRDR